ncbi:MAG: GNAT family N-acetyltransferase [Pseudomonadota bacterium]
MRGVLRRPSLDLLPSYADALRRGWSPDNVRAAVAREQLAFIDADPAGFVASLEDPDAKGKPVLLPDGSTVPRLPGLKRWIWSEDGCAGSIGLRWQPGTADLPPNCLGHIGYGVVPWQRGKGLATAALREILPLARSVGLPHVDLNSDHHNMASRRVMEKAGAVFVGTSDTPPAYGDGKDALYRIDLTEMPEGQS